MMVTRRTRPPQVLILGSGIAGLSTALKFAAQGAQVTVVCKAERSEGSTRYAQGGIASVWSKTDSFEEHKSDTLVAGGGLCKERIVDLCVREGPERVRELIQLGVEFTKAQPKDGVPPTDPTEVFSLHREGGHGRRRILHAADLTGWAIEKALLERVAENPAIEVLEHHIAVDLLTEGKIFKKWRKPGRCLGAYVLDIRGSVVKTLRADTTIIATGGAGKVYLYTSNPDTTTGDGIAMAYRAGAKVANLEFMQFHPTCLYHPTARTFLVTEALRGEGAILRNISGEPFMDRHHPMASLAPRDVVARAIDMEMKRTGDKHVLLDCTMLGLGAEDEQADPGRVDAGRADPERTAERAAEDIRTKFPHIYETCLQYGIDMTREPIPVVPAAHYTCGGIVVDENAKTDIDGLYAIGEAACTGLHGANRLASNSLLEAVVFAHRAVEHAMSDPEALHVVANVPPPLPEWDTGLAVELEEQIDIAANWLEIRSLMWNYVGIVRSERRLERAQRRIDLLKAEINTYYWNYLLTKDLVELRNLITVADLIVQCARTRKESRGLHFMVDHPERDDEGFLHDTVI